MKGFKGYIFESNKINCTETIVHLHSAIKSNEDVVSLLLWMPVN